MSIESEINRISTAKQDIRKSIESQGVSVSDSDTLSDYSSKINQISSFNIDKMYPVGSIYLSMADTDPGDLFGGSWSKLEGRFLLTSDSSRSAGDTGGSNDAVAISHTHTASTNSAGTHTHDGTSDSDGSHTHTISGGSHTHTASTSSTGSHTHVLNQYLYRTNNVSGGGWNTSEKAAAIAGGSTNSASGGMSSAGSHSHTVTVSTSSSHSHTMGSSGSHYHILDIDSAGSHSHTVSVSSAGSDGTNKNMPAYMVINAWQRIA